MNDRVRQRESDLRKSDLTTKGTKDTKKMQNGNCVRRVFRVVILLRDLCALRAFVMKSDFQLATLGSTDIVAGVAWHPESTRGPRL